MTVSAPTRPEPRTQASQPAPLKLYPECNKGTLKPGLREDGFLAATQPVQMASGMEGSCGRLGTDLRDVVLPPGP